MIKVPVRYKDRFEFARLDFQDLELAFHKWSLSKAGYVFRNRYLVEKTEKTGVILMHREVLRFPVKSVDHIDGNKLDNRRANLREATSAEQNQNLPTRKDNRSGRLGVYKRSDCNRWAAFIQKDKKHIYLGLFKTFEEALAARTAAEKELFGDFRRYK